MSEAADKKDEQTGDKTNEEDQSLEPNPLAIGIGSLNSTTILVTSPKLLMQQEQARKSKGVGMVNLSPQRFRLSPL